MEKNERPIDRNSGHGQHGETDSDSVGAIAPPKAENQQPNASTARQRAEYQGTDPETELTGQMLVWTSVIGRWTKAVGIFTGLLFVATVASAVVLYLTDVTLKRTIEANREIASNQLKASEIEARVRLRSYISIIFTRRTLEIDKPFEIVASIIAAGQTPALDVIGWGATDLFTFPKGFVFKEKHTLPFESEQNKTALTPGSKVEIQMRSKGNMTQPIVDAVRKDKTHRFYVWGRVNYRDVFGCKREQSYCFSVDETPNPPQGDPCVEHNDSEGEPEACPK